MYENAKLKLGKNETLYINIANPDGHNAHKLQHDESCCQHTRAHTGHNGKHNTVSKNKGLGYVPD